MKRYHVGVRMQAEFGVEIEAASKAAAIALAKHVAEEIGPELPVPDEPGMRRQYRFVNRIEVETAWRVRDGN